MSKARPQRRRISISRWRWRALALIMCGAMLLAVLSGCRTDAQDKNFGFNNPLDPNQQTGSGGGTNTGQVQFALVDTVNDIAVIVNTSTVDPVDMTSWTLGNVIPPPSTDPNFQSFTMGITLNPGTYVLVQSGPGASSCTASSIKLCTDPTILDWSTGSTFNNQAVLRNASNVAIVVCQSGETCWN